MKWLSDVNRFESEYPRIISKATGERQSVRILINPVVIIKRTELTITKKVAALMLIAPAGISLFLVLELSASKRLSAILLNPMAAFLAKIMQRIIRKSNLRLKCWFSSDTAREKPMSANGIANTVWLNLIREK